MVTTLFLIRHGAVEIGDTKHYYGSTDIPLVPEGVKQMDRARDFVDSLLIQQGSPGDRNRVNGTGRQAKTGTVVESARSEPKKRPQLTAVYCSNLRRATESAKIVATPHGLDPVQLPALRERDFGIWEGMTFTEIKDKYPCEFDAWMTNPLEYRPTGGESTVSVGKRVAAAIEEIVDRHPGETITVVAHAGVNRIILCRVMGIPVENLFTIEQECGAVNIIEFADWYPVAKLMNGCVYG